MTQHKKSAKVKSAPKRPKAIVQDNLEFDDESDEQDVAEQLKKGQTAAVVTGTDWTTETIVSQLKQQNIQLNPRFQRRDAWRVDRKSRFIESLIVGLPIPQIVLAESKDGRGRFIVLDGKQRLLAILQFWGLGDGPNNGYALTGLPLRQDLKGKTYEQLRQSSYTSDDHAALCNQPIRTVVIRNWKDTDFLHTVFLRLNTGSVTLSPQELRQALIPGKFTDYVDETAGRSQGLRGLLRIAAPDPRMRDIEILSRFLAFRFFAAQYPGRMKQFLDQASKSFNQRWDMYSKDIASASEDFEAGLDQLLTVFDDHVARKPDSVQFNRAIFDALIYYHSQSAVRRLLRGKTARIRRAYEGLFSSDTEFIKAVESDTAGAPNTSARLRIWGKALSSIAGQRFHSPSIPVAIPDGRSTRRKDSEAKKK